jgi:hypothetical protein
MFSFSNCLSNHPKCCTPSATGISKRFFARLSICREAPRRKRNSVGGFLLTPIKLKDNGNYDDSSASSSYDSNNNSSKKKQGKLPNPTEGTEKRALGEDFLNFYYDDDEFENTNMLDDYNLTEREWLQILEEEDFFDNGEDSSNNISQEQGSDDLEKELLELEKSLLVSKNGAYGKDEDFWMTGNNVTIQKDENSEISSSDGETFDWLSGQRNYPPDWRADLSVSEQNVTTPDQALSLTAQTPLERALLQGVVPADAGVGSKSLPGDYGFDPLGLATKDLFPSVQKFLLKLLPPPLLLYNNAREEEEERQEEIPRPKALIIRDFREAEIRHGRLAMLAAVIWPLQELVDRAILPVEEYTFTIIYGEGTTLPFLVLLMTLIMMLLGYLDIFASQIKAGETGDAFLPGECFWDPLSVLDGTPEHMKRRMQERELMNGRMAMVAVALYALQEAITHKPFIELQWNQIFFEPVYQIPAIRQWLDQTFGQSRSPTFLLPEIGEQIDFVDIANEVWKEEVEEPIIDRL